MQETFRRDCPRITGLSGGYRDVAAALEADTDIEPDNDEPTTLTEAEIEAYAEEAAADDRVFVRDAEAPASAWMAASDEDAIRVCRHGHVACDGQDCPRATADGGSR